MLMKREYRHDAPMDDWVTRQESCPTCQGKGKIVNEDTTGLAPCPDCEHGIRTRMVPPLKGMRLKHTGTHAEQKFSVRLVTEGLTQGWMRLEGSTLTLVTMDAELVYQVVRVPGRYCCHCGDKLADDLTGALARLHVAQRHAGVASPDRENPAGYCQINAYECVLDVAQHAQWRVRRA